MIEYITRNNAISAVCFGCNQEFSDEPCEPDACAIRQSIMALPISDVVEVETIKAWLYEIAINNVGCIIDGDFSNACEEIISRLDGLRNFAKDRTPQNDEVRE